VYDDGGGEVGRCCRVKDEEALGGLDNIGVVLVKAIVQESVSPA
jgi:hypothetical protein